MDGFEGEGPRKTSRLLQFASSRTISFRPWSLADIQSDWCLPLNASATFKSKDASECDVQDGIDCGLGKPCQRGSARRFRPPTDERISGSLQNSTRANEVKSETVVTDAKCWHSYATYAVWHASHSAYRHRSKCCSDVRKYLWRIIAGFAVESLQPLLRMEIGFWKRQCLLARTRR